MQLRTFPRTIRGLVITVAVITGTVTLALAAAMILLVHWELERQLDQRISAETRALTDLYDTQGFDALARVIAVRDGQGGTVGIGYLAGVDNTGRATHYTLIDSKRQHRAGTFTGAVPASSGWNEFVPFQRADGTQGIAQAMTSPLPDGSTLVVAADRSVIDQMDGAILKLFAAGFGLLLALSMAVTIAFGRVIRSRLAAIEASAEAIMTGDLTRRMPLDGSGGEFDRLSLVLNRMLDRMGLLMDNLRQVSGDIAHDLRTPLQRVRNRLETTALAARGTPLQDPLDAAVVETTGALELFASLLAISEIEGQSIRARFVTLDLFQTVCDMVEIYRPTVEDAGRQITVEGGPVSVRGDRHLLQQVIANLLDNALLHAAASTAMAITLTEQGDQAVLVIADDGPGIPPAEHERVFHRLTRLDASRTTPGHGLGLNLVAAIVAAHDGAVAIVPSDRGLAMRITLPLAG